MMRKSETARTGVHTDKKEEMRMKKWLRRILKWCGVLLLAGIAGTVGFRFLYARD